MKTFLHSLLLACLCNLHLGQAQVPVQPPPLVPPRAISDQSGPELSKLDLDFKGGTPEEFVKAIEQGLGKSVNVIIPDEAKNHYLPALKMREVNLAELFDAISAASPKVQVYSSRGMQTQVSSVLFSCMSRQPTEDSIWVLNLTEPLKRSPEPPTVRFYQLRPYLEQSYKVEDIITAAQTGLEMLAKRTGSHDAPELKFHKDTGLLIAVGGNTDLQIIEEVLAQLTKDRADSSQARIGRASPRAVVPAPANR